MERIDALAAMTDVPPGLTRVFGSPAMKRAHELVLRWMSDAGMKVRRDDIGNLIGRYEGAETALESPQTFLLGSHLDTVRQAGKFDGPLGVLVAIACVQHLHNRQIRLPFAVEVVGFADEEGVRFQSTYLGSRALAGTFSPNDLARTDDQGISLGDAIRRFGGDPEKVGRHAGNPVAYLGYAEVHIEQGPVLEEKGLAVATVTAISGQTRVRVEFTGLAAHAGTVPMDLRKDALCAAAEFVLKTESFARSTPGLVATVGQLKVEPGAGNVIPGKCILSFDARHSDDVARVRACAELRHHAEGIAGRRSAQLHWEVVHEASAVACDGELSQLLDAAITSLQKKSFSLPSGAGHDAAAISAVCPVAMLFVRCRGGISHHPDESVLESDVGAAIEVMNDFLRRVAARHPN
jgi:allantoate deiminase